MKNYAFIWDMDGTLVDSYVVMVPSLKQALKEYGVDMTEKEIRDFVLVDSVKKFIALQGEKHGFDKDEFNKRYLEIQDSQLDKIETIKGVPELLAYLKEKKIPNYLFTHKERDLAEKVLINSHLAEYFEEVVSIYDGFKRKPDPDANLYLVNKYHLEKENTYYVGDRNLDIDCAKNAEIGGILYLEDDSPASPKGNEDYVINDMMKIKEMIEKGEL